MKNNTAKCAILSPDEYIRLVDEVNDPKLLARAIERKEHADLSKAIPAAEVYAELGISQKEIDAIEDVDIE